MGDLVLKGATSGQITLAPTSVAGTNTLTLPAATGNIITSADSGTVTQAMLASNVAGNGPAFSAYSSSNQSVSNSTWTKVILNNELFDTGSAFDASTNYRFTPQVPGYYQFTGSIDAGGSSMNQAHCAIYKNGAAAKVAGPIYSGFSGTIGESVCLVSGLIYLNGTTDYVELYSRISASSGNIIYSTSSYTYFDGFLARAA